VRITAQRFDAGEGMAVIDLSPDRRYRPLCHRCEGQGLWIHSYRSRRVRDLNLAAVRVYLSCQIRNLFCAGCAGIHAEAQDFVEPYARVTRRLARYIYELCKVLTVQDVARHLDLDWKTVKAIDQHFLEEEFGETDCSGLRILAIDEISLRKRHHYLTVVMDYETGRVVWLGEGRSEATLSGFFRGMSDEQREKIEAVAMDMWDPYIKAIRHWCSGAKIVFDLFHVVKEFNRAIDKVRNREYRQATREGKAVLKGSKYLLLKNRPNLRDHERPRLRAVLALNHNLAIMHILKEMLPRIWRYRYRGWARRRLNEWCEMARESRIPEAIQFTKRLTRYDYGILNHCLYPISAGRIEGTNNKLKVIKRRSYGFRDTRYYILKAKQAFPGYTN
jgi:transposase